MTFRLITGSQKRKQFQEFFGKVVFKIALRVYRSIENQNKIEHENFARFTCLLITAVLCDVDLYSGDIAMHWYNLNAFRMQLQTNVTG